VIRASHIRILLAARAAAVANLEAIDAALASAEEQAAESDQPKEAPEFPEVDGCSHPEGKRQDTTTSGSSRSFFCAGCRHTSDELTALKEAP
jgi:hypothetical protein